MVKYDFAKGLKAVAAFALAAVAAIGLSACSSDTENDGSSTKYSDGDIVIVQVLREDGSYVECAALKRYRSGGLSCNWEAVYKGR